MHALQQLAMSASLTSDEQDSIRDWLVEQLVAQEHAKLEQGGHTRNQIPLRRVFVDLPVCDSPITEQENENRNLFLERLLGAPPVRLRTSSNPDPGKEGRSVLFKFGRTPRQLRALKEGAGETYSANLLIGGPGQGKSTLGQIASQIHRASLLRPISEELTYLQRTLVHSFEAGHKTGHSHLWPKSSFLPIQVSLPDLSTWLAKDLGLAEPSLPAIMRFVCELPSSKAAKLTRGTLWKVVRHIPLLLIFDGFDEVGASEDRKRIVSAIREFIVALGNERAHVQIIATTRPQGYAGELEHIGIPLTEHYLVPLLKDEALEYATKLLEAKIGGADEREKMLSRLKEASADSATARLLTTPLQVTILAALVQQIGRAPRERWNLFYRYFSYTYDREIERETYASALLATFRPQIEQIHARVGLLLQVEAERAGGASARMPKEKLLEVINAVLSEDEFDETEKKRLTFEIAIAAGNRLVFLVEPEPNAYGFEIRSLQEFMAAWAISSGRDNDVEARVRLLAGSSIFRNVMLFVASRFYSEASSLRDVIADHVCRELDESIDDATRLARTGALLALEILEEGAVLSQPKRARALMLRAVRLLELPAARIHTRIAIAISQDTASILYDAIDEALERSSESQCFSAWVCLSELINRLDSTALEIAERHWPKVAMINAMLSELVANNVVIGDWMLAKIEARASEIPPTLLYGSRSQSKKGKVASNWAKWFTSLSRDLFSMDRGYLNCMHVAAEDRVLPEFPHYPPPAAWLPFVEIMKFEVQPNSVNLAEAFESLAAIGPESWRDIYWSASWPITVGVAAAETSADLQKFAALARQGLLGDNVDWRKYQIQWQNLGDVSVLVDGCDDLPWGIRQLASSPPLLSLPPWMFSENVFSSKTSAFFDSLFQIYMTASNAAIRRWAALSTMFALRSMKSLGDRERGAIAALLKEYPESLGVLLPKPKALKTADWYKLLDGCEARAAGWVACPENVLKGTKNRAYVHPTLLKIAVMSIEKHSFEFSDEDEFAPSQLRALLERLSPKTDLENIHIEILKLYAGSLSPDKDSWILDAALNQSEGQHDLVRRIVYALYTRRTSDSRQIEILTYVLRQPVHDYSLYKDVISLLRKCLASRKTGLETSSVWGAMGLSFPAPTGSAYNSHSRELPVEPVWLQGLEIKNLGRFEAINFSFPPPSQGLGQWIVILGENGAGKSTLLRSITIALRNIKDPSIWPARTFAREWIRASPSEDLEHTHIRLTLGDGRTHLTEIRPGTPFFFLQTPEQQVPRQVPLFAYGCRRGSALGGVNREVDLGDGMEISTLVDDSAALIHAETWLKDLQGDSSKNKQSLNLFTTIISALQHLLNLERIWVEKRRVWVVEPNGPVIGFSELSDGYLTSAGWFIDLVARWVDLAEKTQISIDENFLSAMTGLVLIDEIDLHLHPKWQVEIIGRTRKILPKMSFVVTTHNPLTLVGAKANEIWVLDADGGSSVPTQGVGSPILLTGGQLFRRYFGIKDIYPDALGRAVQRLSFLSGIDNLSEDELIEVSELRKTVVSAGLPLEWGDLTSTILLEVAR